jgi:hypothetical protein
MRIWGPLPYAKHTVCKTHLPHNPATSSDHPKNGHYTENRHNSKTLFLSAPKRKSVKTCRNFDHTDGFRCTNRKSRWTLEWGDHRSEGSHSNPWNLVTLRSRHIIVVTHQRSLPPHQHQHQNPTPSSEHPTTRSHIQMNLFSFAAAWSESAGCEVGMSNSLSHFSGSHSKTIHFWAFFGLSVLEFQWNFSGFATPKT